MNELSIFVEALERDDPAEQVAFLEKACCGDAALRTRVDKLLHSYSNAKSFLESPPDALIATIAGGEFEASDEISLDFLEPSAKPGCLGKLAQYEVVEVVGRGGMGVVLRAYDTKLNRVVALKVIAPELATNAAAVKRFLREARAAAAVNHDHVVTIHAIHDAEQPPFLVMEFVEGQSLQEKLERAGGFDVQEILRIGMQAAAGLAAAHEQGIVHRDIKPANILLENGVERVKITDFGLARAIDDVSVTRPGLITGTPEYMSPEQARGEAVDHRSDLFSLGGVLYTMCTGRPPFRAESSIAMLRAVLEDSPQPVRDASPEIPAWLEAIIGRLLAKNPDQRLQSARAVSELLGKWLSHVHNPQAHQPPAFTWFDRESPVTPARAAASFWQRVPLALLVMLQLLCVAGFAMLISIEVESVVFAGLVCCPLGTAVACVGWRRSRSVLAVALGLSTVLLLVAASLYALQNPPASAQAPVSWLVLTYELFAIPIGLIALVAKKFEDPRQGWLRVPRFNLRTMLGLMVVAAAGFAAMRLAVALSFVSQSGSPIALTIGVFVATMFALGWVMLRFVREHRNVEQQQQLQRDPAHLLSRRLGRTLGVLIAAVLAFVGAVCLLLWEYESTNYGYVVFQSPVDDLNIERLQNGRLARTYDTLHGGGTGWHVPPGRWEFRIQGDRADYALEQTHVVVKRGTRTTLRIVSTEVAAAPEPTTVWDDLIRLAEQAREDTETRYEAGVVFVGDLYKAEAGLIEAKIQRERSRKNQQEVVALLMQLVGVREKELASVQALHRGGKTTQADLQATIKSLVEAQAALEEVSAGDAPEQGVHATRPPNTVPPFAARKLPAPDEVNPRDVARLFESALLLMTFDEGTRDEREGLVYVRDLSNAGIEAVAADVEFSAAGHRGQALQLSGNNSLRLSRRVLPALGPFTVAGWFRHERGHRHLPVYTEFLESQKSDLRVTIEDEQVTALRIAFQYPSESYGGSRAHPFWDSDRPADGEWYFAAWSHNPECKEFLCVINDLWKTRDAEEDFPERPAGGTASIGLGFRGMIDELAIFGRALSEHDLALLYHRGNVGSQDGK